MGKRISTTLLKFEDVPARKAFKYLQTIYIVVYYCQKLELLIYILAADSMGLYSLVFT